jgi:hypothetical protein
MSIDAGQAIFNQVDANRDGSIDINEFRQWAGGAGIGGSANYESSTSYGSGGYDAGISSGFIDGGSASYDSASYGSGGYGGGIFSSSYGVDSGAFNQSYDVSSSALSNVQTYATDSQGLYQDPNPQIIHRPAAISTQTYTQNVHVRYLQPPPLPPPGVRIFFLVSSVFFHANIFCSRSSLEKFVLLNHLHRLHFAFVSKLLLVLDLVQLYFVNIHHHHQLQLRLKQLFVVYQAYLFHHDQLLSNVYHHFHLVLVRSSFSFLLIIQL